MNKKGQEVKKIDIVDLKRIRKHLKEKKNINLLAFINIGINTALKISELSRMKFEDINSDWSIDILDGKGRKKQTIKFNKLCIDSLNELKIYYKEKGFSPEKGYIFKSLSNQNIFNHIDSPVTINGMSRQFVKLKEALEIPYPIGTESLRKTWGYYVYEETKDIYLVMKVLNKYTIEETLKYIGCLEDTTVNLDKFEI